MARAGRFVLPGAPAKALAAQTGWAFQVCQQQGAHLGWELHTPDSCTIYYFHFLPNMYVEAI